ncbi:hypothetical protein THAOC_31978 [Thalassiosira oceanica]|uniref:Uncharacterized protein n=1 Tax=Thalassiosira oceanica TaxID=159749 RepID=K0RAC8_THAOC|nr:hypothetical protein THAOC_31978 [Thalassiosira oceanica]|eukprot:EJK49179.1 hypothetical protein THAOC_31978 [Thalassiosira oceanica]
MKIAQECGGVPSSAFEYLSTSMPIPPPPWCQPGAGRVCALLAATKHQTGLPCPSLFCFLFSLKYSSDSVAWCCILLYVAAAAGGRRLLETKTKRRRRRRRRRRLGRPTATDGALFEHECMSEGFASSPESVLNEGAGLINLIEQVEVVS